MTEQPIRAMEIPQAGLPIHPMHPDCGRRESSPPAVIRIEGRRMASGTGGDRCFAVASYVNGPHPGPRGPSQLDQGSVRSLAPGSGRAARIEPVSQRLRQRGESPNEPRRGNGQGDPSSLGGNRIKCQVDDASTSCRTANPGRRRRSSMTSPNLQRPHPPPAGQLRVPSASRSRAMPRFIGRIEVCRETHDRPPYPLHCRAAEDVGAGPLRMIGGIRMSKIHRQANVRDPARSGHFDAESE